MNSMNKAIAALDLSSMDDQILQYCSMIAKPLGLRSLDLIHVVPDDFLQTKREYGMPEGSSLLSRVEGKVKEAIEQKVKQHLKLENVEVNIYVLEGDPGSSILNYITEYAVDLLLVGRKAHSDGSGITTKKIARKANCNFLFVPPTSSIAPKRVMVPIDFSENSADALIAALSLKSSNPVIEIVAPHVIRLLPGDYYFGLDDNQDFIDAHKQSNEDAYNSFIKEYNIPEDKISPDFIEDHANSISRRLIAYLNKGNFDLVVIGAQGHTALNTLIFGSVTERIVHYCEATPILVVR